MEKAIELNKQLIPREHSRVKRFSCDVLGSIQAGPVKLNDAACAARCLLQRHKGGYCDNKRQCHCR
ncbi:unnamed protein product [Psylliodes chrysocephalus]|uniref:Invertebrate defensins family profile domain-containing protein n=1 Tax=Psylliodes chrysocephalus TaxID=3402493 RepID=A0A9P0CXM1_9CUCU|nr:unnamed protein product [Psylliodes chrysocephala]